MNVGEILEEIKEKYNHGLSDGSVITKLNTLEKELFRTIYKPTTYKTYDLITDIPFYEINFSPFKIIDVVVNGTEYDSVNVKGQGSSPFYWVEENKYIALNPTPTEDVLGGLMVFHYQEPAELTSSDLTAVPEFDRDFHMLLVYGVCKAIAESYRDYDIANGFATQYNGVLKEFHKGKQGQFQPIQNVYGRLV